MKKLQSYITCIIQEDIIDCVGVTERL